MSRSPLPLAVVAALTVLAAGCGGASTGTGNITSAAREKAVKFAECMRTNGVSQFPDPDASGHLTIDSVANGSGVDTNSAAWRQAIVACKNLEPPGFTGQQRSAAQQQAALRFAQCMRANGVPDFPDPTKDQPLVDTRRIPSADRPGGMAILQAAMRDCSDAAASAGVTGGR